MSVDLSPELRYEIIRAYSLPLTTEQKIATAELSELNPNISASYTSLCRALNIFGNHLVYKKMQDMTELSVTSLVIKHGGANLLKINARDEECEQTIMTYREESGQGTFMRRIGSKKSRLGWMAVSSNNLLELMNGFVQFVITHDDLLEEMPLELNAKQARSFYSIFTPRPIVPANILPSHQS